MNGAPVCAAPGTQIEPQLAYDGLGGAWIAWLDYRDGDAPNPSLFATRLSPNGTPAPGWPVDGQLVSATVRSDGVLVRSDPGGAIVAWQDLRSGVVGQDDVYAQRIVQDGPVAVLVDLTSAVARPDRVELTGYIAEAPGARAVLYRRTESDTPAPLAELEPDGTGLLRYVDRRVAPGIRYRYRLGVPSDGGEVSSREISVLVPHESLLSLRMPYPGPVDGVLTASVSLTGSLPATLEAFDTSGRCVARVGIEHLGPGTHSVSIPQSRQFPAGVYLLRLSEGERSIVERACLLR